MTEEKKIEKAAKFKSNYGLDLTTDDPAFTFLCIMDDMYLTIKKENGSIAFERYTYLIIILLLIGYIVYISILK